MASTTNTSGSSRWPAPPAARDTKTPGGKSAKSASGRERRVWLVTRDVIALEAIQTAIENDPDLTMAGLCVDLHRLATVLETDPAAAAIVDIDAQPKRILADMEPLARAHPNTRFIVLSTEAASNLILEAMQIGARHFLVKESIETDVAPVIRRLTDAYVSETPAPAGPMGDVVTILSAGGGCGATTLAVNLAYELQLLASSPSLVVDMDERYGAVATYLGIGGEYGLADVLSRPRHIDSDLISATVVTHSDGLHVLLSPSSVNFSHPAPLVFDQVDAVIEACRKTYAFTVIDAPRIPIDVAARLVKASRYTLIVSQLNVKDIRTTRAIQYALIERGVPAVSLTPVMSHYVGRKSSLSLEEAERALIGTQPAIQIPNDVANATESMNVGQPLAKMASKSAVRIAIQQLAAKIFEQANVAQTTKTPGV